MGLSLEVSISALTVFLQGILSFFSPCVLPLVPLYIGYLSGGAKTVDADGTIRYRQKTVLINTLFFVLGVSFAFFLLGFGFTTAGRFFAHNQALFTRVGGIFVILFGLYQIGVFGASRLMSGEHRLPFRLDKFTMGPIPALLLGFTFSFAWTPCVGPALASVLLMASSATSATKGFALIGLYTLGFVLPFLAVGFFTGTLLDFFKKHQRVVQYTVKIGGVLMLIMGLMMFTGWMNGFSAYLSQFSVTPGTAITTPVTPTATPVTPTATPVTPTATPSSTPNVNVAAPATPSSGTPAVTAPATPSSGIPAVTTPATPSAAPTPAGTPTPTPTAGPAVVPAPDFTLTDQNGNTHKLSDYKGKVVFLNFWATWCPPCKKEMPDIQALYGDWDENGGDVIILGVANPKTDDHPHNQDVTEAEVKTFLTDNAYTYPVAMDLTGDVFTTYGITAFPTTFMIAADGSVFGAIQGGISRDIMDSAIAQTQAGVPAQ